MRTPTGSVIESKVAYPAIVTGVLRAGGAAIYSLALAEHWISPTPTQAAALGAVGAWALWTIGLLVGYYAPHTPRPDLTADEEDLPASESPVDPVAEADALGAAVSDSLVPIFAASSSAPVAYASSAQVSPQKAGVAEVATPPAMR